MGFSFQYYLYVPRWAIGQALVALAQHTAPAESGFQVKVTLPEGQEITLPSWLDRYASDAPRYNPEIDPMCWLNLALRVPVQQKDRRTFRAHGSEVNAQSQAIVHLHLVLDLKSGQNVTFAQLGLVAYTSGTSYIFTSLSFHRLVAEVLRASSGICAILDYELGLEARLNWLNGQTRAQPVPTILETPKPEFRSRNPPSLALLGEDEVWRLRRFDQAVVRCDFGVQNM